MLPMIVAAGAGEELRRIKDRITSSLAGELNFKEFGFTPNFKMFRLQLSTFLLPQNNTILISQISAKNLVFG